MMDELLNRHQRLQQLMKQRGVDAFVITHNVGLYYFAGSMQTGYLLIPSEGEATFFVRKSVSRARSEYAGRVEPLESLTELQSRLEQERPDLYRGKELVFATEFDVLPVSYYQRLQKALPGVRWVDGTMLTRETRMIKTPYEIRKIKESAMVLHTALERSLSYIHVGMSELEMISRIEHDMRQLGHIGLMRMRAYNQQNSSGIIVSGASAAFPTSFDGPAGGEGLSAAFPFGASRRTFEKNVPILIDVGCCIDGYHIDQSRTIVFGELPDDLQYAYDAAERIAKQTETNMRAGTVCERLYLDAVTMAEAEGLVDHFMGFKADRAKFLGHGIGLELDEFPVLAEKFTYPLQPGMVIAVEPKFTFPGRGVVGTEDTYLITETGCERISMTPPGLIRM
ncbi:MULTISPECIES: Xaa-Pro peptidase family protein [Paenibacillus]|uniref:M24 family metallopeptidase n=1 Tax=Paenibacillus TaxID=44249 RepID=UPI0010B55501|nr:MULTISPECIES: Xaa-Pro peptidase family protein [Paenibacillus]GCL71572.1 aminopeptidase P family protein [Paenibacillus naphthalenovorans]